MGGPNRAKEPQESSQEAPRSTLEASKGARQAPKRRKKMPKRAPNRPQDHQRRGKISPKEPQNALKTTKNAARTAKATIPAFLRVIKHPQEPIVRKNAGKCGQKMRFVEDVSHGERKPVLAREREARSHVKKG